MICGNVQINGIIINIIIIITSSCFILGVNKIFSLVVKEF